MPEYATAPATSQNPSRHYMRNPRKELSTHIGKHTLEIHPPTSIYGIGIANELPITSLKHRHLAWASHIPDSQKRTLVRTITGQLTNFKLISMWTKGRVSPNCPLCQQPDSVSHIVSGGCTHTAMKSRVIKRHDNAVRTLVSAIQKGTKGNFALLADVNTSDDPTDTEDTLLLPPRDDTPIPKRLPNHLLTLLRGALNRLRPPAGRTTLSSDPDNSVHDTYRLLYTQYRNQDESYSDFIARFNCSSINFRPDIAVFEGGYRGTSTQWDDPAWNAYIGNRTIHIIELGYTREGMAEKKQTQKRSQHALLCTLLRSLGWVTHYHTVTIGVTGTIYKDALSAMDALGISPSARERVLSAWTIMTLAHTHGLVVQRRTLDAHFLNQAFFRPP
jgi:hypothetical protein